MPQHGWHCPSRETTKAGNVLILGHIGLVPRLQYTIRGGQQLQEEGAMLWTIAVILLVLWALGMLTAYTAGGVVHLLLVIALIVVVFQFIGGRRGA
jgi:uncharacterized protein DUF5670